MAGWGGNAKFFYQNAFSRLIALAKSCFIFYRKKYVATHIFWRKLGYDHAHL